MSLEIHYFLKNYMHLSKEKKSIFIYYNLHIKVWWKLNIKLNVYSEREDTFGFMISFFSNLVGKLKYPCINRDSSYMTKTLWQMYFRMHIRKAVCTKSLFNSW